jgi:LysM repeat protein
MPRSASKSRRHHPTAVVLSFLILFIAAVVALFALGSGGDDTKVAVKERSSSTDPGPTVATLATTSTTRRPEIDYPVKAGDTLTSIARQFHLSTALILDVNEIPNPDNLVVGQVLVIPRPRLVQLVVTPKKIDAGESVTFEFQGAQPDESVFFVIAWPGGTFTGPSHSSSTSGKVETSYQPAPDAPGGTYVVTAKGNHFTTAQATFRVVAAVVP